MLVLCFLTTIPDGQETIEQLQEFERSLSKMTAGNITLVDHVNAAQLAIQTAIRSNTSPEILQMFLKKENGAIRTKLSVLESDHRLGRISHAAYEAQAGELLALLDKLKEPLSPAERELLNKVRAMGSLPTGNSCVSCSLACYAFWRAHLIAMIACTATKEHGRLCRGNHRSRPGSNAARKQGHSPELFDLIQQSRRLIACIIYKVYYSCFHFLLPLLFTPFFDS